MASLEDVAEDLQRKKDDIVDMAQVRKKYGNS